MKLLKTLFGVFLLSGVMFSTNALAETAPANTQAEPSPVAATQAVVVGDKLNINTATAEQIQHSLIGIGAKKAEAVVQYREKHGAFTAVEQLLEVQGIGKATLEKNRDRIVF
ncbi:competence protein ComE [Pasteurellaceae bacterium Pebbles2]|nr:competence protein ComE [Pasteurellaceae bacterium Pebbles2]